MVVGDGRNRHDDAFGRCGHPLGEIRSSPRCPRISTCCSWHRLHTEVAEGSLRESSAFWVRSIGAFAVSKNIFLAICYDAISWRWYASKDRTLTRALGPYVR